MNEAEYARLRGLVLRSLHLDPAMDSEYRRMAYMMDVSKAELMRTVLEFGEKILKTQYPQSLEELKQVLKNRYNYPLFGEEE